MNGPAQAHVTDVAQAAHSAETLGFPVAEIMFDVHGAIEAPMTLGGSYKYPEIETKITGDAVDLPLLGRVAASAAVVADTKTAAISAIDLRQGTSAITGDVVANIIARGAASFTSMRRMPSSSRALCRKPGAWRAP
jgi:hypothetical protein